jgi:Raf kinase inhibitor-like YbhB/YbcL family protein
MKAIRLLGRLLLVPVLALGAAVMAVSCSSMDNGGGTGGHQGSGGVTAGTGGSGSGSGGATHTGGASGQGGATGAGGVTGAGGITGAGGVTGAGGSGVGGAIVDAGSGSGGSSTDAGAGTGGRGTGGAAATDAGPSDGGGATMTLTSTAFTEGGRFPAANTCTGGAQMSPALAWTGAPAGTQSFAIVLTDMSNNFHHWVIWDIPATATMLAANLAKTATLADPANAREVNRFGGTGYSGPCPQGTDHMYQFEVHALDTAMLNVGATVATTEAGVTSVRTQILAHTLGHGDLTGISNASP